MYTGQLVRLREYTREDVKKAQEFVNDPEVKRLIQPGIPFLYTFEDEMRWFEKLSANNKDYYSFAIETLEDKKYIGGCGINQIDWKNSVATVGIFIGDKSYWGKGYGTDTMDIMIKLIFDQMNIHKIKLQVFSFNDRAIKSYEKSGFRIEGVLRQELYRDGRYYDEIVMGLLREEYELHK